MHEMGVVVEIIKIAETKAKAVNATYVNRLTVQVGQTSGVVPKLLKTCFAMAVRDTMLENAVLETVIIPDRTDIIVQEIEVIDCQGVLR